MSHHGTIYWTGRSDEGLTVSPTLFDNLVKSTLLLQLDIHFPVSDRVSLLLCLAQGRSLVLSYKVSPLHHRDNAVVCLWVAFTSDRLGRRGSILFWAAIVSSHLSRWAN